MLRRLEIIYEHGTANGGAAVLGSEGKALTVTLYRWRRIGHTAVDL